MKKGLRGNDGGDEELRTVGILAGIGHGEETLLRVLKLEVLVRELLAIDYENLPSVIVKKPVTVIGRRRTRLATGTITLGEITALDHELLDDTVESRALVTEAVCTGSQSSEVLSGLGDSLAIETHDNAANGLIALSDIEINFVGDFGAFGSFGG